MILKNEGEYTIYISTLVSNFPSSDSDFKNLYPTRQIASTDLPARVVVTSLVIFVLWNFYANVKAL